MSIASKRKKNNNNNNEEKKELSALIALNDFMLLWNTHQKNVKPIQQQKHKINAIILTWIRLLFNVRHQCMGRMYFKQRNDSIEFSTLFKHRVCFSLSIARSQFLYTYIHCGLFCVYIWN